MLRHRVSQLRRGEVELQLNHQFGVDLDAELPGDGHEAAPAIAGVGAECLASHEGNLTVSQLMEVPEGKLGGAAVVEQDVGHPLNVLVTSNGYDWDRQAVLQRRVDGDEAF